ncbi:hypothetical protein ACFV7Q_20010 [Streptomyces sp. NPDC059851]|uniref:hypothetical protein n=1 Tax=Streptomyces sp. NPDC059851 TaxID=3346971 RepID=UPI003649CAA4
MSSGTRELEAGRFPAGPEATRQVEEWLAGEGYSLFGVEHDLRGAEDMVRADAYFRDEFARTGEMPKETSIEDILGSEARDRFSSYYRDPNNLSEFKPVDFEDGSIVPVRIHDGKLTLHAMFANPSPVKEEFSGRAIRALCQGVSQHDGGL